MRAPDSGDFTGPLRAVARHLADVLGRRRERPVSPDVAPGELVDLLPTAPPREAEPLDRILDDLFRAVVPRGVIWNHPRFFTWFTSSATPGGIAAETVAAALNTNTMSWDSGRGLTELEEVTAGWVADLLGLAPTHRGIILDGGSSSTFHALAAARSRAFGDRVRAAGVYGAPPLTVYRSVEAHSSVDRAVVALGLGTDQLRTVPVDDEGRMVPDALDRMIEADVGAGRRPGAVVATVGSTGRGAVDPVAELADVCARRGVWLHVDAAYGGAVAALPEGRALVAGWERADSIVVNPHKWLFVPLDLSLLFLRDPDELARTFTLVPSYLDHEARGAVRDPMDYGIPLGRRARALKLWVVMRELGVEGIRRHLRRHLALAEAFADRLRGDPRFEGVARSLSVVTFRRTGGDAANRALEAAVNRSGRVLLGHTEVEGRYTLRVVFGHVETGAEDVEALWEALERAMAESPRSGCSISDRI